MGLGGTYGAEELMGSRGTRGAGRYLWGWGLFRGSADTDGVRILVGPGETYGAGGYFGH